MKAILNISVMFVTLFANSIFAQEKNIETHSIDIENFISYIVENYEREGDGLYNLIFLIQTSKTGYLVEDKVVLKQGFSLLSKRLSEDNSISILGYFGINGVALKQSSISKIKKILHAVDNFESSVKEFQEDGITFAYEYVDKNFDEDAINRVVMIRIPQTTNANQVAASSQTKKKKNNAIVLTAIALLPEIISVLKD